MWSEVDNFVIVYVLCVKYEAGMSPRPEHITTTKGTCNKQGKKGTCLPISYISQISFDYVVAPFWITNDDFHGIPGR